MYVHSYVLIRIIPVTTIHYTCTYYQSIKESQGHM